MSRSRLIALAGCLFLLVVGARWALFNRYGTDMPEMDQWDAEGLVLLVPWSLGQLHWGALFIPHNEHRVVLSRLVALTLTAVNGQWDQRLEAVFLALLPAVIAVLWWRLAARRLAVRWQIALFCLLAACFALPVASQNVLAGFSTAQFFLIGLSLGAVATLPFAEPFQPKWWVGAACVLLALGSMATGFFAAGIAGGLLAVQVWRGNRAWASAAPALILCGLSIGAGFLLQHPEPLNAGLKAHSVGDFVLTLAKALGWPAFDFNWGFSALVLSVPWALVAGRVFDLRRRQQPSAPWPEFLSGMGLWVLLQAMAAAYARGAGGPSPASRYVDTLIVGSVVNLLCLHVLWQRKDLRLPRRNLLAVLVGSWGFLFVLGLAGETYSAYREELAPQVAYHVYCEQNLHNYLVTGDEGYLRHAEIPYPNEAAMKIDLDYVGIASRLPVSVRRPIGLGSKNGGGFVRFDGGVPDRLNHQARSFPNLAPGTPALDNAVIWGCFDSTEQAHMSQWRSEPFVTDRSEWLKISVAGDLGRPGTHLELRDAATGQTAGTIVPDRSAGHTWRSAWVLAPAGRWVLAAENPGAAIWFAFSQPTEMSRGSHLAWQLARHGTWLAWGAGLLALGMLAGLRFSR